MKRIFLLIVVVAVVVALAFMALPEDPGQNPPVAVPAPVSDQSEDADLAADKLLQEAERDARLERMKEVFARLERERRDLRIRLDEVAFYVGEASLSADEAEQIREDMNKANRLLINPPLLGAFRDAEAIQRELDQVLRNHDRLREILAMVKPDDDSVAD
ncbi:MAG: hypothetical protein WD572_06560 [Gammaproteobacteria bacterium]